VIAAACVVLASCAGQVVHPTAVTHASAPDIDIFPNGVALSVEGHAVKAAPPGVRTQFSLSLSNAGRDPARGVNVALEPLGGAQLDRLDASYGDIPPDGSAARTFTIVVDRAPPCNDSVGFLVSISYLGGLEDQKFGVPVACLGPRLTIDSMRFVGGDGDGVPEPGETLRVSVVLRNDGRDPARNVRARVSVSGQGVTAAPVTLTFGDIEPGGKNVSRETFILQVSTSAPVQHGCARGFFVGPAGSIWAENLPNSSPSGTATPVQIATPQPAGPPQKPRDPAARMTFHMSISAQRYAKDLNYSSDLTCSVEEGSIWPYPIASSLGRGSSLRYA